MARTSGARQFTVPMTLTSMRRANAAGSRSAAVIGWYVPALSTARSMAPSRSSISATQAAAASRSVMSSGKVWISGASDATSSSASARRALMATRSPARAACSASARPRPELAPVIDTVRILGVSRLTVLLETHTPRRACAIKRATNETPRLCGPRRYRTQAVARRAYSAGTCACWIDGNSRGTYRTGLPRPTKAMPSHSPPGPYQESSCRSPSVRNWRTVTGRPAISSVPTSTCAVSISSTLPFAVSSMRSIETVMGFQ